MGFWFTTTDADNNSGGGGNGRGSNSDFYEYDNSVRTGNTALIFVGSKQKRVNIPPRMY